MRATVKEAYALGLIENDEYMLRLPFEYLFHSLEACPYQKTSSIPSLPSYTFNNFQRYF